MAFALKDKQVVNLNDGAKVKVSTTTNAATQKANQQKVNAAAADAAAKATKAALESKGGSAASNTSGLSNTQKQAVNQAAQNAAMIEAQRQQTNLLTTAANALSAVKNPVSNTKTGFKTNLNDPNSARVQPTANNTGRTTVTTYTGASLAPASSSGGGGGGGYVPPTTPTTYEEPTPSVSYSAPSSSGGSSSSGYTYSNSSYTPTQAHFEPSAAYYKAMEETQRLLEQLKGGRTSYTDKINAALKGIEENPAFAYDFNTDPLFQSALASAMRSGQSAMQDTMGQAAALTGGYGNTYGQKVGNQAYNQYIQGAYDNLPDYYNLARNAYDADLANKYNLLNQYRLGDESEYERMYNDWKNQYTMANDQYAKEYENYWQEQGFNEDSRRFLESIRQFDNDFNFKRERADVEDAHWDKTFDYNAYRDSVADEHWDKQFNYNAYRDGVSDSHWNANYQLSKSAQDWEQQYKEAQQKQATSDVSKASQTLDNSTINMIKQYANRYGVGENSELWNYAASLESRGFNPQEIYDVAMANAPELKYSRNASGQYIDQFQNPYTGTDSDRYVLIDEGKDAKKGLDDIYLDTLTGEKVPRSVLEVRYPTDWKNHVDRFK